LAEREPRHASVGLALVLVPGIAVVELTAAARAFRRPDAVSHL